MNSSGSPPLSHHPDDNAAQVGRLRDHLRLRPDDGAAWLALAQLLASRTAGAELHHALEQAIQSGPESIDAWLLAARVHRRQRGSAAALQWLAHWSRQNPGLAAPRTAAATLRAEAARQAGQWQEALDAYREVEQSRPQDPVTLNDIGSCLASMEAYDEAEGYFEGVLRQLPEFTEARFNLGLLRACQGRDDAALRELDRVLADPGIAQATRGAAETLRETLREHRRLQPWLDQAVQSGTVDDLQQALNTTPDALSRPHRESLERLQALAAPCRSLGLDFAAGCGKPGNERMQLLEAYVLSNSDIDVRVLADLRAAPRATPGAGAATDGDSLGEQCLRSTLEIVSQRTACNPAVLQTAQGEAWLKYWHARLLADEPEKRPGQYKLSANAIRNLPLTPPDRVSGTLRAMLTEFLPGLPAGMARGLFLYVGINMIHGFGDGNGRLSRFLLAWECEAAGLAPVLVPSALRAQTARALDRAWLESDLQPLVEAMEAACAERDRLLGRLTRRAPPPSF